MFASLFEVLLLMQIQEEIHHFAGWGGGLKGHLYREQDFVNKLAFPDFVLSQARNKEHKD